MTEYSVGSTTGTGESTTEQVKDEVRDKAQVAQEKARGAVGQARGRLSEQVDQRSTQAGKRIGETASDVRTIAEQLRNQGNEAPANLAEQVAGQVERVGDYLKDASGDRILRDVEDFARRQPMLVTAAGLALGFAASRFLKASSSRRYQPGYQNSGDRSYGRASTSPYDTRTAYRTEAGYETDVPPYAPSTTPATGTPVVGTYDPHPVQAEPLRDAYDERRS
jgi:vacuolar-type H+-ATPase subunit H